MSAPLKARESLSGPLAFRNAPLLLLFREKQGLFTGGARGTGTGRVVLENARSGHATQSQGVPFRAPGFCLLYCIRFSCYTDGKKKEYRWHIDPEQKEDIP